MTQNTEICPICLDSLAQDGDHQICSLSCGHLCGLSCLQKWFSDSNGPPSCPKCRKSVDPSCIISLKWNGTLPKDNASIQELKCMLDKNISKCQKLEQEIGRIEREINISSAKIKKNTQPAQSIVTINKVSLKYPSLILEKKVNSAFKLAANEKKVVFSEQKDNFFGISSFDGDSFCEGSFIKLHSLQIKDISLSQYDPMMISTVSFDTYIKASSLRTDQCLTEIETKIPLWSCSWIRSNVIGAGGTNGIFMHTHIHQRMLKKYHHFSSSSSLDFSTNHQFIRKSLVSWTFLMVFKQFSFL